VPKSRSIGTMLRGPVGVLLACSLAYTVTWAGHYTSGDGAQKVAWAEAMLFRHSADIDPGPGVSYSRYGVGHSLLAIPPLALAHVIEQATGLRTHVALYTLLFVANGALFLALVFAYLRGAYSVRRSWAMVCLLGFATIWWPYTKLDFSEPLVLTAVFGAFLFLRGDRPLSAGLAAGIAVTIRPDALLLVMWLLVWRWWHRRDGRELARVCAGLAPSLLVWLLANAARSGNLWAAPGYEGSTFATPLLVGLYGILLSAGKSVFLYSPPLVLGIAGWRRFRRTAAGREDALFFLGAFVLQTLFYACWWDWSGDDAWGVRFLIPGVMLLAIPAVELVNRRALVGATAAIGCGIQLLGVLVCPLDYVLLLHGQPALRRTVLVDATPNRIDVDDLRFHPRYSQIAGHVLMLRVLMGIPPARADNPFDVRRGTSLYDALPAATWRAATSWDFAWGRVAAHFRGWRTSASAGPRTNQPRLDSTKTGP